MRALFEFIKFIFYFSFFSLIALMAGWIVLKAVATNEARKQGSYIIRTIDTSQIETGDEMVMELAAIIHKGFVHSDPTNNLYLKARPYVTDKRLHPFLRLDDGVIEMNLQTGSGLSAAHILRYVLYQAAMDARLFTIIADQGVHTILIVTLPDTRRVFVDPFYGFVAFDPISERLLSPRAALSALQNGAEFKDVFTPLESANKNPDYEFAANMYYMAASIDDLD